MSKQDRQKLSILVVLLGVLGLTLLLGYRMVRPSTAETVQPVEVKASASPAASNEVQARIRAYLEATIHRNR